MSAARATAALLLGLLLVLPGLAEAAEVVLWHSYRGAEEEALGLVADAFQAQTGHTVARVAVPFGAFDSKVETAIPRGNGPDLFIAAHGSLGKWSTMGLVQPWPGPTEVLEAHRPVTVEALAHTGVQYGLPLAYKSLLLLYDPELVDTPPTTTEELIAMAKEHTGDGRYGLAYQATEPYFHAPWMHAFGAAAYTAEGEVQLDGPEHTAAFAFTRRLGRDEGIVPPQPTAELITRLYQDGNAAFVISGPWFLADIDRPVAAAPLPMVSEAGAPAQPYLTVDGVFLADQAPQPDAAVAFMAFLAGPEGSRIRQEVGRQAVSATDIVSEDPLLQVLAVQSESAVPLPTDPGVLAVWEAQARAIRRVIRGAAAPETAAREAQTHWRVLSRPAPPPADPRPYLVLALLVLGGLAIWLLRPLADPAFRSRMWAHRRNYLWVLPAGLAMSVLVVLPFVTGAAVSLFAHHQGEWTFVGLRHFLDILLARDWPITSPMSFAYTLGVTVLWTVTNLTLHVAIGVALAMVLREPWIRMRGLWRALLIIPWAVPNYITALIWKGMFHAQYGAVNALLGAALGLGQPAEVDWFGSFATGFCANLTTNTWLGFPFMMVVTLGALQAVPRDLEEAAEVDGAGWWFRFRHVVWPLLRPALLPAVILGSIWTFNMFNIVYLVSAGEPDGSTEILISEAYRWAFSRGNRYGYAAAYAVIIFGVLLMYSRGVNRVVGRRLL
jgi:arabinogalactan oligomer/maltooligosaccharide transport system permease protein